MLSGNSLSRRGVFLILALSTCVANGAVNFYTDFTTWSNAVTESISTVDLYDANEVALADEVGSAPSDGVTLPTSVLTFDSANTGLDQDLTIQLLESAQFVFRLSGPRLGLEPASTSLEDFRQTFSAGVYAIAFEITEQQQPATWNLYDINDQLVGTTNRSGTGDFFYGVISDTQIAYAEWIHNPGLTDNVGIGTQYFVTVPEPGLIAAITGLFAVGLVVWRRRRQ